MNEEQIQIEQEELARWFRLSRKDTDKPCFWRIFKIRALNSTLGSKAPALAVNYSTEGIEDSAELLMEVLSSFAYVEYVCICLVTSNNERNYLQRNMRNPFYTSANLSGVSQAGNGAEQVTKQAQFRFDMMKELFATQLELEREKNNKDLEALKQEFKHTRELEKLRAEIEGVKSANTSMLDKIIERLEPVLPVVMDKLMNPQNQAIQQAPIEEKPEPKNDIPQELRNMLPVIAEALKYYPDLQNIIGELAVIGRYDEKAKSQVRISINQAALAIQQQVNNTNNGQ